MFTRLATHAWSGTVREPTSILIETGNSCNLRCPLCPTGIHGVKMPKAFLTVPKLAEILGKFRRLRSVELFMWGEPLLNPHLPELIAEVKRRGLEANVSSNFSLKMEEGYFARLVDSGLDRLVLSLDGATQATYAKYRVGGQLALALANLDCLLAARAKMGSRTPRIAWKFIVHKHNAHEVASAREMARDRGVEFLVAHINLNDYYADYEHPVPLASRQAEWLPEASGHRQVRYRAGTPRPKRQICPNLFQTAAVTTSGHVLPCSYLTRLDSHFGDLGSVEAFAEIWNGPRYRSARSLFVKAKKAEEKCATICERCPLYDRDFSPLGAMLTFNVHLPRRQTAE